MPPARTLLRLRVVGRPPERDRRALIIAPNHQPWIDPFAVQYALFPHRLTFLMTELYYDLPVAGLYFRAAGARPIREAGPSVAGLRAAREALEDGEWVSLFPEGRITTNGEIGAGRRGIARLAHRTGARVLPVGVRGAIDVFSKVQPRPRLGRVSIHLGEPMDYVESADRDGEQRFTDELMRRIRELAGADSPQGR